MIDMLFVGHYSHDDNISNVASSAAGDLVQKQIINECKKLENIKFKAISMQPCQSWPKGDVYFRGGKLEDSVFPFFVNIPILKSIIFAFLLFCFLVKNNPGKIIVYNNYFFENIAFVLYKIIRKDKVNITLIIQDFREGEEFSFMARIHDQLASKILSCYDYFYPISEALAIRLRLDKSKYHVFEGGIHECGMGLGDIEIKNYATFAGALEKHNGVDRLVDAWSKYNIEVPLHIYGRGSLSDYVKSMGNEYIFFHGFCSQDEVMSIQENSKFNFCFRYSEGLNQDYFFPSKFFNAGAQKGLLIVNKFNGLTDGMIDVVDVVDDELSNLHEVINQSVHEIDIKYVKRTKYLSEHHRWENVIRRVNEKA